MALLLVPALASAAPVRSYWRDGLIWSDLPDGRTVRGGTVAGIGMVEYDLSVGFVRTTTDQSRRNIAWPAHCVTVSPVTAGLRDLSEADVLAIVDRSMANWMTPTRGCSDFQLVRGPTSTGETGFDSVNRIVFREDRWCRPAGDGDAEVCHNPGSSGLTRVFFIDSPSRSDDGEILDADIEINAVYFALAKACETSCETMGAGTPQDLENTLTHELGHLLGLGHTCWDGMDPPVHPVDQTNTPIPMCESALSDAVLDATMYPYGNPMEVIKRSIEADEINAICAIYPGSATAAEVCAPSSDGCSCDVGGRPRATPWWLLLLLLPFSGRVRRWFARSSA